MNSKGKLLAIVAMAACAEPPANDPAGRATEFIKLARAGKCREAFVHYTTASQQNLLALSKRFKDSSPYVTEANEAFRLHCHVFAEYLPKTVTEAGRSPDGDTAHLRAIMRTGWYIPIPFWIDPIKDTPVTITMARENGEWKLIAPHVRVDQDADRQPLQFGKFEVKPAWHQSAEVRAFSTYGVMTATPEQIEAVMLDVERWPDWMPQVAAARAATELVDDGHREKQRVYVRHAASAAAPGADFVIELAVKTSTPDRRVFQGTWRAVADPAPSPANTTRGTVWDVQFTTSVDARGVTGMHFEYAALPAEWPEKLQRVVFEPQHGPALLAALEQEALRRAQASAERVQLPRVVR